MSKHFIILFFLLCIIPACAKGESNSNNLDLSQFEGRRGVIGQVDFDILDSNSPYTDIAETVGKVIIFPRNAAKQTVSTGLLVSKKDDEHRYVLTVKHAIYDSKTGKKISTEVFFYYQLGTQKNIKLLLNMLPDTVEKFGFNDDMILIPVSSTREDHVAKISLEETKMLPDLKNISALSLIAINNKPVRILQDNLIVKQMHISKNQSVLATDADVFLGMSGSPVIGTDINGDQRLIGVISKTKKIGDCKEFSKNCFNIISYTP